MSFDGFMTFDPYLTFAEGERGFRERIFLQADGTPSATWYDSRNDGRGYLSSLWRVGREAYATVAERLGEQPKVENFKVIAEAIRGLEKDLAPEIQQLIQDGRLILHEDRDSPPVTSLAASLEDAPDGWLLEIFMRLVRPSVISGHMPAENLPDFEGLLCATAVMYIDDYIIAENLDADNLDMCHDLIQTNIASAKLYRETLCAAKEALSAMGRRSASALHEQTNQQKAKAIADWEAGGHNFSTMRAFARNRYKEYGVTDFMTVYNWLRKHNKTKS